MSKDLHQIKPPILTRNFINITVINFIVFFCFQMVFPILPLYVKQMGGSDSVVGMVLGIFTFSTVVARPLTGYLLDRYEKKLILIFGLVIFVGVIFSYGLVTSIGAILWVRVIHGFGWGFAGTATSTIASELVPKSRFGEGMGYFSLANSLAMALAPAFGIYIGVRYGDRNVFLLSSAIALFALIGAFFLKCKNDHLKMRKKEADGGLYEKKAIVPGILLFFTAMAYGGVISFLPLYAAERGIPNIGIFFVVYALSILVTRPTVGKMVDRYGFDLTIIPGFIFLLVALILLANIHSLHFLLIVAVIYGVGFGALITSLQTMAVRDVEKDRIGAANATLFTGNDVGIGIGVMILGAVAELVGYSDMYLFTAIPLSVALIFYVFYVRKVRHTGKNYSSGSPECVKSN